MKMGKYRTLMLNTVLFAMNAIATKLISFFLVPLYTTYMSAGEFGLTDMSLTVIGLITPLVTLDISEAAVRYIISDKEKANEYAATAFIITLISVLIVAILTPCLDFSLFGGLGNYKIWFIVAYATAAFMNLCSQIARGLNNIKIIPFCAFISAVCTLVFSFILIGKMQLSILGYFISVSIGPLLATIIYMTIGDLTKIVLRGLKGLFQNKNISVKTILIPMLIYALPLIPNSLFWWAGTSINRLFITGMLSISASGLFAAASKIPNLVNTAYSIFQSAWQLSAFQESKNNISQFFSYVFNLVQVFLSIFCSGLIFFAPFLSAILLRGETYVAWKMTPILLIANLLNVFNSFYGTVYSTTMHTAYVMKTTALGAIVCTILTPLLIPVVNIYGACIASAVGQGLVFILRVYDSRRYISFNVKWHILIPVLIVLTIQSFITISQPSFWWILSLLCLFSVTIIQLYGSRNLLKKIIFRLIRFKSTAHR